MGEMIFGTELAYIHVMLHVFVERDEKGRSRDADSEIVTTLRDDCCFTNAEICLTLTKLLLWKARLMNWLSMMLCTALHAVSAIRRTLYNYPCHI